MCDFARDYSGIYIPFNYPLNGIYINLEKSKIFF